MKTVTYRFRNGFQAIEPECGLTGFPSVSAIRLFCGLSISQVDESPHASNVAGQRNVGKGLPKSTHSLPAVSFQNRGCPSGAGGGLGVAADFFQSTRSCSKLDVA